MAAAITKAEEILRGASEVGDEGDGGASGGAGEDAGEVGDEGDGRGCGRGANCPSDDRAATQETRAKERA